MKLFKSVCLFVFVFISISTAVAQIDPGKIDIVRDKYGVPHIYGKTDPEVSYGLAWAHAEDDFETIQQTLLAGKAMLALYKGKQGATIDYIIHLLRIPELVAEKYDSDLSPDFKKLVEGYCAGINAYAAKHPDEVLVKKLFLLHLKMYFNALFCNYQYYLGQIKHYHQSLMEQFH